MEQNPKDFDIKIRVTGPIMAYIKDRLCVFVRKELKSSHYNVYINWNEKKEKENKKKIGGSNFLYSGLK